MLAACPGRRAPERISDSHVPADDGLGHVPTVGHEQEVSTCVRVRAGSMMPREIFQRQDVAIPLDRKRTAWGSSAGCQNPRTENSRALQGRSREAPCQGGSRRCSAGRLRSQSESIREKWLWHKWSELETGRDFESIWPGSTPAKQAPGPSGHDICSIVP